MGLRISCRSDITGPIASSHRGNRLTIAFGFHPQLLREQGDILPAGFAIEVPRLRPYAGPPAMTRASFDSPAPGAVLPCDAASINGKSCLRSLRACLPSTLSASALAAMGSDAGKAAGVAITPRRWSTREQPPSRLFLEFFDSVYFCSDAGQWEDFELPSTVGARPNGPLSRSQKHLSTTAQPGSVVPNGSGFPFPTIAPNQVNVVEISHKQSIPNCLSAGTSSGYSFVRQTAVADQP